MQQRNEAMDFWVMAIYRFGLVGKASGFGIETGRSWVRILTGTWLNVFGKDIYHLLPTGRPSVSYSD